jgi:hypothetical protein
VSLAKTNVMGIGTKDSNHVFKFGDEEVSITNEYKYLGTVFSNDKDTFKRNLVNQVEKTNNAIYALTSYIRNTVGHLQPNLALKMFDVQICPIMEYGSEVWFQNKNTANLEKIHLAYLKNTLKAKMSTSTIALYAELGRFPIALKLKCRIINYWKRILDLSEIHPVKQAYNTLKYLNLEGQTNWCTTVREILEETYSIHLWYRQSITEKQYHSLRETLHKRFMNSTMEQINNSSVNPKLRTYKLFKSAFQLEPFLSSATNINHTIALTKFRISSHNLAIETGRHTKPNKTPVEERFCIHCNRNEVETEEHFILTCPMYNAEREELIEKLDRHIPNLLNLANEEKFIVIMSHKEKAVTDALGKYISQCMYKRNHNVVEVN